MTTLRVPETNRTPFDRWILPTAISVLALADGLVHLSLDFVLFRGNFFGAAPSGGPRPGPGPGVPGPPPGGLPPRLPLPLNELFLLNFAGFVVLVLLIWFSARWLGQARWLADLALALYTVATFAAWYVMGRPNPMGLGYLSKGIEVVLIVALLSHIWIMRRSSADSVEA